jgi:6,7-dimethyl-8-ribityllumazine synthase
VSDYENEEPEGFDENAFPLPEEPLFAPPPEEPSFPLEELPLEEPEPEPALAEDSLATFDPFAGWPESDSSALIEEAPPETESVEHVRGEVEVPIGYAVLEGTPLGKRRSVGIVVSRFNGGVTNRMLQRALDALAAAEVPQESITVVPVPGAFELPLAAMALAKTRRYACIVALGAIVRGETPHFDYVASECASGLQLAGIETGVPVAFGVLTVDNVEQAEARVDKASEAVRSALEMADLFARLRASARA